VISRTQVARLISGVETSSSHGLPRRRTHHRLSGPAITAKVMAMVRNQPVGSSSVPGTGLSLGRASSPAASRRRASSTFWSASLGSIRVQRTPRRRHASTLVGLVTYKAPPQRVQLAIASRCAALSSASPAGVVSRVSQAGQPCQRSGRSAGGRRLAWSPLPLR